MHKERFYIGIAMIVAATMSCILSHATGESPERTVIESLRGGLDVDLQRDLVLFASGNMLYAYDLKTGRQRWSKPRTRMGQYYSMAVGADYAVMFCEQEFLVLDKETGREVWKEHAGRWRPIRWMHFEDQTNWVWRLGYNERTLYNLDERKAYKTPLDMRLIPIDLSADPKIMYGFKEPSWDEPPTKMEVFSWELSARAPVKRYVVESPGVVYVRGISGNEFLVSDRLYNREPEQVLRIHHLETGEVIRELDATLSQTTPGRIMKKGDFYFWEDKDENLMHRINAAGSELTSVPFPNNHELYAASVVGDADTNNRWWFTTVDDERNFWLLLFDHDAPPRKLLDGRRFLPGWYNSITLTPPYLRVRNYSKTETTTHIYRLQGMEKIAEWPGDLIFANTDMTLVATCEEKREGGLLSKMTYLFRHDHEAPLFKVQGEPLSLSPDGRYLLVRGSDPSPVKTRGMTDADYEELRKTQSDDATIHIIEVESQQSVAHYDTHKYFSRTAFSPDSRFLAMLNHLGVLKIIDMESGFTEKHLVVPGQERIGANHICFSPNSERLLTSGRGQVYVFDVSTGKHLFTLKETARFPNYGVSGSGDPSFLQRAEGRMRDFLGRYTDRLKNIPQIHAAFMQDGAQVVTVAGNMLLRVWDTETGRLVRTIDPKLPEQRTRDGFMRNVITLSANGAYAVAYNENGFDDGALWDVVRGRKVRTYTFKGARSVTAAVSEDGKAVYALINGDLHYLKGAAEER